MSWDNERTERARKLWREGYSASVIASALGGVTRNAVIGRMHRIGESGRFTPTRTVKVSRPRSRLTPEQRAERARQQTLSKVKRKQIGPFPAEPLPPPDTPAPLYQRKTLLELQEHHCRWPIGNPGEPEFHFCGATKVLGSYCETHARQAYQPAQTFKGHHAYDGSVRKAVAWKLRA